MRSIPCSDSGLRMPEKRGDNAEDGGAAPGDTVHCCAPACGVRASISLCLRSGIAKVLVCPFAFLLVVFCMLDGDSSPPLVGTGVSPGLTGGVRGPPIRDSKCLSYACDDLSSVF